jgi:predicted component of type VI protein secretion system
MNCTLTILSGPAAGRTITVKDGETVTVGRNKNALIAIPEDQSLSGLHFSIKCDPDSCVIQDLGSTNKTFVNYDCVSRAPLKDGDVIHGGESHFEVKLSIDADATADVDTGNPISATAVAPAPARMATESEAVTGFVAPGAVAVLERFGLKDDPELAADDKCLSEKLVEQLQQRGHFIPALRFLAYALPKRCAVWWVCQCVRQASGDAIKPEDLTALDTAETWVKDPTEDNRRAAMAMAEKQKHASAACWANVGAFWSGGSMAPPASPVIPPGDDLTGKAIYGAVQLAAVAQQPEKAPEKHKQFITIALAVCKGENTWAASKK